MKYSFKDDPSKILIIENDAELYFAASMVQFTEFIEIRNCTVKEFDVFGMYCGDGLMLKDCIFECEISWQSGGHNNKSIIIENCVFKNFVDFEDCCFDSEIIFRNVRFLKGTNLLGNKGTPVRVAFDKDPIFENVEGDLAVNTFE